MPKLFCGTSGFAYATWKPDFYPAKLASKKFLEHYAQRLNAVEINYTFRRLPSTTTLESWVNATPPGFVFPVKAHMRITHIQKLKPSEFTDVFYRAIDPLRTAGRLGPVLFQLAPSLKCDTALLADFLPTLPSDLRSAFEFRHASWLTDPVYELLRKHGAALCLAESERLVVPEVITADFVYSRSEKARVHARKIAKRSETGWIKSSIPVKTHMCFSSTKRLPKERSTRKSFWDAAKNRHNAGADHNRAVTAGSGFRTASFATQYPSRVDTRRAQGREDNSGHTCHQHEQ